MLQSVSKHRHKHQVTFQKVVRSFALSAFCPFTPTRPVPPARPPAAAKETPVTLRRHARTYAHASPIPSCENSRSSSHTMQGVTQSNRRHGRLRSEPSLIRNQSHTHTHTHTLTHTRTHTHTRTAQDHHAKPPTTPTPTVPTSRLHSRRTERSVSSTRRGPLSLGDPRPGKPPRP